MHAALLALLLCAEPEPQVVSQTVGDVLVMTGSVELDAPVAVVWAVLTDYDNQARFIPGMSTSRTLRRSGTEVVVSQRGSTKLLFASITAQLELAIHESPTSEIDFRDVSRRDFELYRGKWTIDPEGGARVRVTCQVNAKPRMSGPLFLKADALAKNAKQELVALRNEINRRAASAVTAGENR